VVSRRKDLANSPAPRGDCGVLHDDLTAG
jgi:hypothetical protein